MKIRSITAPNPSAFTLDGTRTYLLGDTAVIDPGPLIDSHIAAIRDALPRLDTIFLTHRHDDHVPAAKPLKDATGARVIAPRGIAADIEVKGGERFEVDGTVMEVIATPGHTNEHVCYLTADGDLFSGDTVLGAGTTAIFPPDGSMSDYLRSLELLRSKHPKRIHPAHGPDRDNAVELIDQYIAHRHERERQVLDALGRGAQTIPAMRAVIYPDLDPRLTRAAEIQILAHLIKLQQEQRVAERDSVYTLNA